MLSVLASSLLLLSFVACPLGSGARSPATEQFVRCVPRGTNLDKAVINEPSQAKAQSGKQTVRTRLVQLEARCKRGKLVDGKGRQIYLYLLLGCWGNPPPNYLELMKRQDEEISRLKKRFTVIQIPCGDFASIRAIS
jgi:hypothetical protein